MIIGISSDSNRVSPHFGRAPAFTFIEIEDQKVIEKRVIANPGHTVGSIPKLMKDNNVDYMITGGIGHRARDFFSQYNIEIISGVQGEINDVVERILKGEIKNLQGEDMCTPSGGKGYGIDKINTDDEEHHHHFD